MYSWSARYPKSRIRQELSNAPRWELYSYQISDFPSLRRPYPITTRVSWQDTPAHEARIVNRQESPEHSALPIRPLGRSDDIGRGRPQGLDSRLGYGTIHVDPHGPVGINPLGELGALDCPDVVSWRRTPKAESEQTAAITSSDGQVPVLQPIAFAWGRVLPPCSATIILSLEQQLEFPSFPSKNQRRAAPPFVKRSAAERNKRGGGTPHAADAPSRPLRRLGRLGPLGLLQPVTGDVQLQDHAVMHQAVDRRRRRHRVLENHFPLRER